MCGFSGIFDPDGPPPGPEREVQLSRMARLLHHRGPDDSGTWQGEGFGLAHARLSIIDTTAAGHQPMVSPCGRYALAYNGEIYNFEALREALSSRWYFKSHCDTEVVLAGYAVWGEGVVERLDGMFAFAVADSERKLVFLARDRIGEKPLFYARAGANRWVFGSEPKALLVDPGVQRAPNYRAIHHYLSFQYIPSPMAAFAGMAKLPAGHCLLLRSGAEPQVRRYWDFPAPDAALGRESRDCLTEEIRRLMRQAVKRRMIADVPVGAFLSGGVDSSAVTAFMSELRSEPLKTFTIGFEEADHDERAYARIVAERFGCDHHEEIARPDFTSLLDRLAWHYNEPFADPSAVATYQLARLASRHVKVSLSGDGGDELFVGYGRYAACQAMEWSRRVPAPVARVAAGLAAMIPAPLANRRPFRGARRRLKALGANAAQRYEPTIMYYWDADKAGAAGERLVPFLDEPTSARLQPYFDRRRSLVAGAAFADLNTYLPDDILTKVDIATMAVSLEARTPFLDPDLAAFAARIPAARHLEGGLKGLLRDALRPVLPDTILDRDKKGFGLPLDRWLRGPLREACHDLIASERFAARGLVAPGHVARLIDEHDRGFQKHQNRSWALMMLEVWFRNWVDSPPG
jgi:asparagine synthase (glutamine-hydrolysing)